MDEREITIEDLIVTIPLARGVLAWWRIPADPASASFAHACEVACVDPTDVLADLAYVADLPAPAAGSLR